MQKLPGFFLRWKTIKFGGKFSADFTVFGEHLELLGIFGGIGG
jgi:hypothetical protein